MFTVADRPYLLVTVLVLDRMVHRSRLDISSGCSCLDPGIRRSDTALVESDQNKRLDSIHTNTHADTVNFCIVYSRGFQPFFLFHCQVESYYY